MDETGCAIGQTGRQKTLVYLDRDDPATVQAAGRLSNVGKHGQGWVTASECVSASGRVLPPLVILQGEGPFDPASVPDDRECESWHYATSASGWSSNYLGLEWLKTVFLLSESRLCPNLTRRRPYCLDHRRTAKRLSPTLLACPGVSSLTFQLLGFSCRNDLCIMEGRGDW
jgi:hypothetical protein